MGKSYVHVRHVRQSPSVAAPLGFAAEPVDELEWKEKRRKRYSRPKRGYCVDKTPEERKIAWMKERHELVKARRRFGSLEE